MAKDTKIEWADHTFNPWEGCTKISPACDFCYAAERAARFKTVEWGGPRRRTSGSNWNKPRKWERAADEFFLEHGRRQRVFCASLADVFDNQVPDEWREDLWYLIRETSSLDWLLLTKRPQNIEKMLPPFWDDIKDRIWLGTTVENQEVANRNIPHLLKHDSAVRFLSMEPLLGPVELDICNGSYFHNFLLGVKYHDPPAGQRGATERGHKIDWVIAGGESGPKSRPSHRNWFRSIRDQCERARVPFLFKQWGEWSPDNGSDDMSPRSLWISPDGTTVEGGVLEVSQSDCEKPCSITVRYGKKISGRLLDGIEHTNFPPSEETPYV